MGKTVIKAYTTDPGIKELFPIVPASSVLPKWYKKMPTQFEKHSNCPFKNSMSNLSGTMKTCHGISSILHRGFIMPMWEDISIGIYPDGTYTVATTGGSLQVDRHDNRQAPEEYADYIFLKIPSPWFMRGNADLLFLPTTYHNGFDPELFRPYGVTPIKYVESSNFFFAAKVKDEPYEVFIKAGTPLWHIIPLQRDTAEIECIYDPHYKPLSLSRRFFLHGFYKVKHLLQGGTK